jgi:hypothetical protein
MNYLKGNFFSATLVVKKFSLDTIERCKVVSNSFRAFPATDVGRGMCFLSRNRRIIKLLLNLKKEH